MITCWKHQPTSPGTKDQPSFKPWTISSPPKDHWTSHWDFHSKMFTRSVVSERSQSEESKPVSLDLTWTLPSHQSWSKPTLSPLKCIMKLWPKPNPVTTSDSTSNLFQLRTLKEVMYALTPRTTLQENVKTSWLKLLSWTIQDKSKTDIAPYWIATLPTLPSNSKKFFLPLTEELVRSLKNSPSSSSPDKLAWLECSPPNPCALKYSQNIPH